MTTSDADDPARQGSLQLADVVVPFPPEATLIAYTDGVTDAVGAGGDRFGMERLLEALRRCGECNAQEVIDTLARSLDNFGTGRHADDTAAVVVRRAQPAAPAAQASVREGATA